VSAFTQAIAEARRQGSRFYELRATTSLARLWRGRGRGAEARDLLAPIYDGFTEGFDTEDLKEAKALLDEWYELPTMTSPSAKPSVSTFSL
jgi:predicted ATPase